MKKNIYLAVLLFLTGCQNELYKNPLDDFQSEQGVYIANNGVLQSFVEEGKDVEIKGLQVALAVQDTKEIKVTLEAGNQAQLDAYNAKNGTNYIVLPKEMYEISQKITFMPLYAMMDVPISLKNVKFSLEGNYALPIRITGGDVNIIRGQEETLLVLEQRVNTKALRISTSGSGSTRFGDVTINPNQLQIKTGSSQIDVPADKFSAQPDTWYMLAFVYDGQKNYVYVNGVLVADREIRTGPYGLIGFWIGGSNELIREVRFWKTARTSQEIASNIWKMVNPDDDNLLLYYPLNGKKRDSATGEITEDETLLWDWSKNGKNLPKPSSYSFDDNKGNGFIFPPQE